MAGRGEASDVQGWSGEVEVEMDGGFYFGEKGTLASASG